MAGQSAFEFSLDWNSALAAHRERRVLACDLDRLSAAAHPPLAACQAALASDGSCRERFAAGELVPAHAAERLRYIDRDQFDCAFGGQQTQPEAGRYYPRAMIAPALGCSRRELTPFLLTEVQAERLGVDLNHPLAGFELVLSAHGRTLQQPLQNVCTDTVALLALLTGNGPGMQAKADAAVACWFACYPFERADEEHDSLFYRTPRLLSHIDATASAEVAAIYARFIKPGMKLLDLMSSWQSHLPGQCAALSVTGLGLNEQELAKNPCLDQRVLHDLNQSPALPFPDQAFDLVICSVSVEYLTRPLEVFREVARVLKPRGVFINTFSHRWFPPKAISLWARLHPFERLALVMNYYRKAGGFQDLRTESLQGLPRPPGDKYYGRLAASDPVFAVWGARSADVG